MGNIKSLWTCFEIYTRQQVVEVLRPDGTYEEFAEPVEVSVLMRLHPDHLVVHCSSFDRPVGSVCKIMVMRPDQELALGNSYLLHPIPPQYRKRMFRSQSIPAPKAPLGLGPEAPGLLKPTRKARKLKRVGGKRAKRLAALRDLCANLLQPLQPAANSAPVPTPSSTNLKARPSRDLGPSRDIAETPSAPLLDSRGSGLESSDEKPRTSFGLSGWRPALDSIPESPLRTFDSEIQTMKCRLLSDY